MVSSVSFGYQQYALASSADMSFFYHRTVDFLSFPRATSKLSCTAGQLRYRFCTPKAYRIRGRKLPFHPHSLPYKLRLLFDAKICTPQDISRATGIPIGYLDKILRGWKVTPQARHAIGQAISFYARREAKHLRLLDAEGPIEDGAGEGVFEELDAAPGQIELKARDAKGSRMALLQFRADVLDDELLSDLERWHARHNPTRLTLADASEQRQ